MGYRLHCEKQARVRRAIKRGSRITKGRAFGRVLWTKVVGGREVSLHATRGFKSMRA